MQKAAKLKSEENDDGLVSECTSEAVREAGKKRTLSLPKLGHGFLTVNLMGHPARVWTGSLLSGQVQILPR